MQAALPGGLGTLFEPVAHERQADVDVPADSGAGTTKAPGPDHSGHGAYQGRGLIPSSHQLMRRVSVSSSSSNASAYLSSYSE